MPSFVRTRTKLRPLTRRLTGLRLPAWSTTLGLAACTTSCLVDDVGYDSGRDACGPCGDIELGDSTISSSPAVDGFFRATLTVQEQLRSSRFTFNRGLSELEATWGLASEGDTGQRVTRLLAAIRADFGSTATARASVSVSAAPSTCRADAQWTSAAQVNCEAWATCEAELNDGLTELSCAGTCQGPCSDECSPPLSSVCSAPVHQESCIGQCAGLCVLSPAQACSGTCTGSCGGICSGSCDQAFNPDGSCPGVCEGACEGACEGLCETAPTAECGGMCTGNCLNERGGNCNAGEELLCDGQCQGQCSGDCIGVWIPSPASENCDMSALCQDQASAQGSAHMRCTPTVLSLDFFFDTDLAPSERSQLNWKAQALRDQAPAMLGAFTQLEAMLNGKVDGKQVFETPPLDSVSLLLGQLLDEGVASPRMADVQTSMLYCAMQGVRDASELLVQVAEDGATLLSAQRVFATAVRVGFEN